MKLSSLGTSDILKCTTAVQPQSSSGINSTNSNQTMIKGTRAINRDVKVIMKQNLYDFEFPNEDDIFIIDFNIKCGGLWKGLNHKFRFNIPINYPFTSPTVICLHSEKSYHPNIQKSDGSICLNLLNAEGWKAMYTLTDICSALSGMFLTPNWEHSLNQDVFISYHDNKSAFFGNLKLLGASYTEDIKEHSADMSKEHSLETSAEDSSELATEMIKSDKVEVKRSTRNSIRNHLTTVRSLIAPAVSAASVAISSIKSTKKNYSTDLVQGGVDGIKICGVKNDENIKKNSSAVMSSSHNDKIMNKIVMSDDNCELNTISETFTMVRERVMLRCDFYDNKFSALKLLL